VLESLMNEHERPPVRTPNGARAILLLWVPPRGSDIGWRTSTRLPRDHYIRFDGNDYSVHPVAVGRRIEVTADLGRVRVWCAGNLVADHDRVWAKHQTISDPAHVQAARQLRRQRFDVISPPAHVEVEQRRLTDYDAVLGLDGPVA
jgi:transposase